MSDLPTKRELEQVLHREAGLSRSSARAFVAGGYPALVAKQDAAGTVQQVEATVQGLRSLAALLKGDRENG